MTIPLDGQFTGKSCEQVDASNETSDSMGFQRPSFDGFGYSNETGTFSGSPQPWDGDSVTPCPVGHQSPNDYQSFDPDASRTQNYGNGRASTNSMFRRG